MHDLCTQTYRANFLVSNQHGFCFASLGQDENTLTLYICPAIYHSCWVSYRNLKFPFACQVFRYISLCYRELHRCTLFDWLVSVHPFKRLQHDLVTCNRRLANNLNGKYKRAVGLALQICIGNLGGIIASNIFRTKDEPRYILGREYLSCPFQSN